MESSVQFIGGHRSCDGKSSRDSVYLVTVPVNTVFHAICKGTIAIGLLQTMGNASNGARYFMDVKILRILRS